MTPFASHFDHPAEFLLMEILGTYLFPLFFVPCPNFVVCLMWSFHSIQGIIDHSNAQVPHLKIDAKYHFTHHKTVVYNYAEFEILDKLAGTLYEDKKKQ